MKVSDIKPYEDVRGKDLSALNLKNEGALLKTLDFNTYTKWPASDKMPSDFDPEALLKAAMDPGLSVRKMQDLGYTGKGVTVAYVDQPLLKGHSEYQDLDLHYEKIADEGESTAPSMHGPAVLSLLAGKHIGIVPEATVYFMGAGYCGEDQKNEAAGFERLVAINKTLPEDQKIKVIGMSHRVADTKDYQLKNSDRLRKAMEAAEKEGIIVIDCDTFNDPVLLIPDTSKDVDDPKSYAIGEKYTSKEPKGKLCVPTARTYAAGYVNNTNFYEYSPCGGQSWSVPYIVGVIAMGLQVDPNLTKAQAVQYLYESGTDFEGGKIINPEGFVEMVKAKCAAPQKVTGAQYATNLKKQSISFKEETAKVDLTKILTAEEKSVPFNGEYGLEGLQIKSVTVKKESQNVILSVSYSSNAVYDCSLFLPPNDMLNVTEKGIEKGEHQFKFTLTMEAFEKIVANGGATMRINFDDPCDFIWIDIATWMDEA